MKKKLPLAIQLIFKHHVKYCLFTIVSLLAIGYALLQVEVFCFNWLDALQFDIDLDDNYTLGASIAIQFILYFLTACMISAILLLPIRYSLHHNCLIIWALLCEIPFTFSAIVKSCFFSIRIGLYYLFPAIAMCFMYFYWAKDLEKESIQQLYLGISLLVTGLSIVKSIPALIAPVITGCFDTNPRASIQFAVIMFTAYRSRLIFFFLSYIVTFALIIAMLNQLSVSVCLLHLRFGMATLEICKWEILTVTLFIWIFLTELAGTLIKMDIEMHPGQEEVIG